MSKQTDTYARIPAKDRLLESDPLKKWSDLLGRALVSRIIDRVLDSIKENIPSKAVPDFDTLLMDLSLECRRVYRRRVIRVINGTGIILHTNMGRSPIPGEAWDACRAPNTSYSNLELDLETGKRGKRNGIVPDLLSLLTGAEASMVVNNNAAAVFLILSGLARGSEVIVSRGEQVQIGGGFRIPEILSLSGARLVEIGTTNITTLEDYRRALSGDTACVLSVHRSNFALRGFTSRPSLAEIKKLLPPDAFLFVDQGSGTLTEEIRGETRVSKILRDGADLVSFSCDKVLGGPQAGIISGREDLIRRLDSNQLYRVFRPGKTIYSLLEEILVRKVNGDSYLQEHIFHDPEVLESRAKTIAAALPGKGIEAVPTRCSSGGGSSPDETYPSAGLRLTAGEPGLILNNLREADIPVIGYIAGDSVYIDLAAVDPADDMLLTETIRLSCVKDL